LPQELWGDIELQQEEKVSCHDCILVKHPPGMSRGWRCDTIKNSKVCRGGVTGFGMGKGVEAWWCKSHDFDLCINCTKVDKFMNLILNRED
jgi:hypothetical protein